MHAHTNPEPEIQGAIASWVLGPATVVVVVGLGLGRVRIRVLDDWAMGISTGGEQRTLGMLHAGFVYVCDIDCALACHAWLRFARRVGPWWSRPGFAAKASLAAACSSSSALPFSTSLPATASSTSSTSTVSSGPSYQQAIAQAYKGTRAKGPHVFQRRVLLRLLSMSSWLSFARLRGPGLCRERDQCLYFRIKRSPALTKTRWCALIALHPTLHTRTFRCQRRLVWSAWLP